MQSRPLRCCSRLDLRLRLKGVVMGCEKLILVAALSLSFSCTVKSDHVGGRSKPEPASAGNPLPPSPVIFQPSTSNGSATPAVILPTPTTTASADAACYKGDALSCRIEALIIQKTNALRGGRGPLRGDGPLNFVARQWSATQGKRHSIGHDGFPSQRARAYSQEFGAAATVEIASENVAMSGYQESSAEAVAETFTTMWWESRGHKANMVGDYAVIGVGVFRSGNGWYATQIFGN